MRKSEKNNGVRIIGGDWRGHRLQVVDVPGLRPTGDRCRETLFNWLQPWIMAADCADLFAGTGALGFEAASRGAASVLMIEKHPLVRKKIRQTIEQLQADQIKLLAGGALALLSDFSADSFDLVFVDPPFDSNLSETVLARLTDQNCVKRGGFIYLESPASVCLTAPEGWSVWRDQRQGEIRMQLFRRPGERKQMELGSG